MFSRKFSASQKFATMVLQRNHYLAFPAGGIPLMIKLMVNCFRRHLTEQLRKAAFFPDFRAENTNFPKKIRSPIFITRVFFQGSYLSAHVAVTELPLSAYRWKFYRNRPRKTGGSSIFWTKNQFLAANVRTELHQYCSLEAYGVSKGSE